MRRCCKRSIRWSRSRTMSPSSDISAAPSSALALRCIVFLTKADDIRKTPQTGSGGVPHPSTKREPHGLRPAGRPPINRWPWHRARHQQAVDPAYHDLIYYNQPDQGDHFAAWEQPPTVFGGGSRRVQTTAPETPGRRALRAVLLESG